MERQQIEGSGASADVEGKAALLRELNQHKLV